MKQSRWIALLLILAGAACYGLLSPFIKLAYEAGWNKGGISASQLTMGKFKRR